MMIPRFEHSTVWIRIEQRNHSTMALKLRDMWSKNKTEVSIRIPEHGPSSSSVEVLLKMMMGHVVVLVTMMMMVVHHVVVLLIMMMMKDLLVQLKTKMNHDMVLLKIMMDHVLVFELKLWFYFYSTYHVRLLVFHLFRI